MTLKKMTVLTLLVALLAVGGVSLGSATQPRIVENERLWLRFDKEQDEQNWRSINDDVMGGVSSGTSRLTPEGILVFSGVLSLENRGGFASIRSDSESYRLDGVDALVLRVRGDGRSYWLDLRSNLRFGAFSYRAGFATKAGEWQELRLPLKDFRASAFGQTLPLASPLEPASVKSVGFTIADKKAGPFRLEIAWIKAISASEGSAAATSADASSATAKDVVDTAIGAGKFKTLVAAVQAAGLVDTLKGDGPFTVFAPTDEAFAKLSTGTVENLLKPENRDQLTRILKHHVLAGRVSLADGLKAQKAQTLANQSLTLSFSDGRVRIGSATLLAADTAASNGVIHVIDSVLIPSKPTVAATDLSLIELAIERGVPLFNSGQVEACKAVYELAVHALLRQPGASISASTRQRLEGALDKIQSDPSARTQAWTLRHALDGAWKDLSVR